MITSDQSQELGEAAGHTLSAFEQISAAAKARLASAARRLGDALAVQNSFTGENAIEKLASVDRAERDACERLSREPAIARVVVDKGNGVRETIYVARAASSTGGALKVASYRSPLGRLASLEPGDILETGPASLQVVERALLRPEEDTQGWDALNTVFETADFGPITVESLRRLQEGSADLEAAEDEIAQMLREEAALAQIAEGRKKAIIDKMGLRDQPVLDKLQDRIFRLPLDARLGVLGAPGSGKTTTLIKRLGQKLDPDILEVSDEGSLISRATLSDGDPHTQSWLMFVPTDLLRGYVKEAFAEEGIAAPDSRIKTWPTHQRLLARSHFPILQGGLPGGSWRMRDGEPTLLPDTIPNAQKWFEDFDEWQRDRFWADIADAATALAKSDDEKAQAIAARVAQAIENQSSSARRLVSLVDLAGEVRDLLETSRATVSARLRAALNARLAADRSFIDRLASFMDTLAETEDPESDGEAEVEEDDEVEQQAQTPRARAIHAFNAALRLQARRQADGKRLGRGRSAAILGWLDQETHDAGRMAATDQEQVGKLLIAQSALRAIANPVTGFVHGVSRRYRGFRRARRGEELWYVPQGATRIVNPHEIDLILLASLRAANEVIIDRTIWGRITESAFDTLHNIVRLHRNQILVDEVTDFSPVQLACMAGLANPRINSVFICGDFNQRITSWGMSSSDELRWAIPGLEIEDVKIAYRQSRQLYEFGRALSDATGGHPTDATLPANRDNEGVAPALAEGLADEEEMAQWLASRIAEIDHAMKSHPGLPSTAVLVRSEDLVEPVAAALDRALEIYSLRAVPCVKGQIIGQAGDVRVFDVQHIKGLEFEAVFFLGIDQLAEALPQLFDRYLYVGATRAATYLGVTCETRLPTALDPIRGQFCAGWSDAVRMN